MSNGLVQYVLKTALTEVFVGGDEDPVAVALWKDIEDEEQQEGNPRSDLVNNRLAALVEFVCRTLYPEKLTKEDVAVSIVVVVMMVVRSCPWGSATVHGWTVLGLTHACSFCQLLPMCGIRVLLGGKYLSGRRTLARGLKQRWLPSRGGDLDWYSQVPEYEYHRCGRAGGGVHR